MSLNELKLPDVQYYLRANHQLLKRIINVYQIAVSLGQEVYAWLKKYVDASSTQEAQTAQ
jgi:hypothetical protein